MEKEKVVINEEWLEKRKTTHYQCVDDIEWICTNVFRERNINSIPALRLIEILKKAGRLQQAMWIVNHIVDYAEAVRIAIYIAESVRHIVADWWWYYPRAAEELIEAAKKCLKNPTEKNKRAAYSVASASKKIAWDANSQDFRDTFRYPSSATAVHSALYVAINVAELAAGYSFAMRNPSYYEKKPPSADLIYIDFVVKAVSATSTYAAAYPSPRECGRPTVEKLLEKMLDFSIKKIN